MTERKSENHWIARDIPEQERMQEQLTGAQIDLENRVRQRTAQLAQANSELLTEIQRRQEMEEKYRHIFENSLTAIAIMDDSGRISMVNKAFEQLSGYTRQEIVDEKRFSEFFKTPDAAVLDNVVSLSDPSSDSSEVCFFDCDGQPKELMIRVAELTGDSARIASMLDVSSLKNTQRTLLESQKRFKSLSDSAPDIIYTLDTEARFTYVNPAWTAVLGHVKNDVVGRKIFDFVKPETVASFQSYFSRILHDRETIKDAMAKLIHIDRSHRIFNVCAAPYIDTAGDVMGIVGIFKDITEHRKLEEQLRHAHKMEAIGTLGGGIAHNFNNVLMGILGNTSLLRNRADLDGSINEKLQNIEQYVHDGTNLTQQLLGFARGGKFKVRTENPNDIVGRTARMFGLTHKEITINKKFAEAAWPLEVDRTQIEQVLLNMYVNAFQAMPGGGSLELATKNMILSESEVRPFDLPVGRYVRISVTDTGHGMDPATQERIFEPFYTTKEMGQGTGLGLSSAYGIIKDHGGFINVYSIRGTGTTFNIYLPAVDKSVDSEAPENAGLLTGTETVLLIDDEEMIIEVGRGFLQELGYRVLTATGAREGIRIFQQHHAEIDLVVLDMVMPDMGGSEAFDCLRAIRPDIKVLLASGYSLNGQAAEIQEKGCDGFIQKPFNLQQFSIKLRDIFDAQCTSAGVGENTVDTR